jgi:hypothetical protein
MSCNDVSQAVLPILKQEFSSQNIHTGYAVLTFLAGTNGFCSTFAIVSVPRNGDVLLRRLWDRVLLLELVL